jgi:hypothetical protein
MLDFDIAPFVFQVLGDKAAMAMVRLFLAAKQTPSVQHLTRYLILNPARLHEIKELPFL